MTGQQPFDWQRKPDITLTLQTNVDHGGEITATDVEWLALRTGENGVALLIKLNDKAWERYRCVTPWALDINNQLRSNVHVDLLTRDSKHKIIMFDATSVTAELDKLLTPVSGSWTVTTEVE